MDTPQLPKLYLNPHCPRFSTAPVKPDGSFDNVKFGKLLQMQEGETSLNDYIETMRETTMEDVPLIRARESSLVGVELDGLECNPATWESLPEDYRAMFELVQ